MVNKRFIADLMPKDPIYIPLLPKDAQDVIGAVHQHTKPAMRILEDEGFESCDMVDIFEAGPVVRCPLNEIRAVRESRTGVIHQLQPPPADAETYLISNCREPFRAAQGQLAVDSENRLIVDPSLAAALNVQVGDTLRFVAPRGIPKAQRYHDANISFD
jgi:arginine N-succinyltransferase